MTAVHLLDSLRKPIVLLAAVIGFVALGVSLARVPGAAEEARVQLEAAADALGAGDHDEAAASVERARNQVDTVQLGTEGPAGLLGQWLPVVGQSARDARHLGDALDAATRVAETGAELAPQVTGPGATFFEDKQVDLPTLQRLIQAAGDVDAEVDRAIESLDAVEALSLIHI